MRNKLVVIWLMSVLALGCKNYVKEEGYLNINENKIHYKVLGKGKPLVFVHGGYLNLDMWENQVQFFSERGYKTIVFSDLGHGKTALKNSNTYGYEIIDQIVEKVAEDKVTLVGLSWGAMLSVDYALNFPEKIEKLVLVSPGLNGWSYFQDSVASENYTLREVAMSDNDTLKAAELFHKNWAIGPRRNKAKLNAAFVEQSFRLIKSTMQKHWKAEWSKLDTLPAIDRLEKINVPTLVLIGEEDAKDILMIGEKYHKDIPKCTLIEMENVAHLINMEKPELFNQILSDFLNEK
ncbi:MAG: alpha/beta hydrolase [Flavobacteriaceae bacterium]|nr:alpha/beta hydrolase [Flavobacteriaceae bacterium]